MKRKKGLKDKQVAARRGNKLHEKKEYERPGTKSERREEHFYFFSLGYITQTGFHFTDILRISSSNSIITMAHL